MEPRSVGGHFGGTARPDRADRLEPLFEHCDESPRPGVLDAAKLPSQAVATEDWNLLAHLGCEASVRKPNEQVEDAGRGGAFAHQAWPTSLISFGPPQKAKSSPNPTGWHFLVPRRERSLATPTGRRRLGEADAGVTKKSRPRPAPLS